MCSIMHDLTCSVVILPLWMLTGSDWTPGEGASGHLRSASGLDLTVRVIKLNVGIVRCSLNRGDTWQRICDRTLRWCVRSNRPARLVMSWKLTAESQ